MDQASTTDYVSCDRHTCHKGCSGGVLSEATSGVAVLGSPKYPPLIPLLATPRVLHFTPREHQSNTRNWYFPHPREFCLSSTTTWPSQSTDLHRDTDSVRCHLSLLLPHLGEVPALGLTYHLKHCLPRTCPNFLRIVPLTMTPLLYQGSNSIPQARPSLRICQPKMYRPSLLLPQRRTNSEKRAKSRGQHLLRARKNLKTWIKLQEEFKKSQSPRTPRSRKLLGANRQLHYPRINLLYPLPNR